MTIIEYCFCSFAKTHTHQSTNLSFVIFFSKEASSSVRQFIKLDIRLFMVHLYRCMFHYRGRQFKRILKVVCQWIWSTSLAFEFIGYNGFPRRKLYIIYYLRCCAHWQRVAWEISGKFPKGIIKDVLYFRFVFFPSLLTLSHTRTPMKTLWLTVNLFLLVKRRGLRGNRNQVTDHQVHPR